MSKSKSCSNLNAPACYRDDGGPRDRELRECFCGTAYNAIGPLEPGCEIFGFTKGQFSLMDLITAILSQTGYFEQVTDAIFEQDDVGDTPTTREVDDHFQQLEVMGETYDESDLSLESNNLSL